MTALRRSALGAVAGIACVLTVGKSHADNVASPAAQAPAQALFEEARQLTAAERYAEACPKFAESQKLDPGMGTQFYLADCLEHIGQIASAWFHYMDVVGAATLAGQNDRKEYAQARADALKPRLHRLRIDVGAQARQVQGLTVLRDGVAVGEPQWGLGIPVDPGPHVVAVTVKGKKRWTTTVHVKQEGSTVSVVIPAPVDDAPPAWAPVRRSSTQRTAGIIVSGLGVTGLVMGTIFGVRALAKESESNADGHCDRSNFCDSTGLQLRREMLESATISTVGFISGGVALAGGATLLLTAPSDGTRRPGDVSLRVDRRGVSLAAIW